MPGSLAIILSFMIFITATATMAGEAIRRQTRRFKRELKQYQALVPFSADTESSKGNISNEKEEERSINLEIDSLISDNKDYPRLLLQKTYERQLIALLASEQAAASEVSQWMLAKIKARFLFFHVSLLGLDDWIKRTPILLVSLGLLGTFIGLVLALWDIDKVLAPDIPPAELPMALSGMLQPMGIAFLSSLFGLVLSLCVIIIRQLRGISSCLEELEIDTTCWIEQGLVQHQEQLYKRRPSRVRDEMAQLVEETRQLKVQAKDSAQAFQAAMIDSLNNAVKATLSHHLDEIRERSDQIFNQSALQQEEARLAVSRISEIANSLNEAGQDFVNASVAFKQSKFATELHTTVQKMFEGQEIFEKTVSTLCKRMESLRESITGCQDSWQVVALTAEQELATCRLAVQSAHEANGVLTQATEKLQEGREEFALSTQALRTSTEALDATRQDTHNLTKAVQAGIKADATLKQDLKQQTDQLQQTLMGCQTDWQQVAKAAEEQLQASRLAVESVEKSTVALEESTAQLKQGQEAIAIGTNALKSSTTELGAARQETLKLTTAIQSSLESDAQMKKHLQQQLSQLQITLVSCQDEWKLVAQTAQQELQACNQAVASIQQSTTALAACTTQMQQGQAAMINSTEALQASTQELSSAKAATVALSNSVQAGIESDAQLKQTINQQLHQLQQSLSGCQEDWQRIASTAERELETCRNAINAVQQSTAALETSSSKLKDGQQELARSTQALQASTQTLGATQQDTLQLTQSIRERMKSDINLNAALKQMSEELGPAIQSWSNSVERVDQLAGNYVDSLSQASKANWAELSQQQNIFHESVQRYLEEIRSTFRGQLTSSLEQLERINSEISQSSKGLAGELRRDVDGARQALQTLRRLAGGQR